LLLAGVLLGSAAAKAAHPARTIDGLRTFGLPPARRLWVLLVAIEASLGAGVALGSSTAAYASAALLAGFALVIAWALTHGRQGSPCGCLGSRGRVTHVAVGRNVLLAVAFASLPSLQGAGPATDVWLALGVGAALVAAAAAWIAVLALAREVASLRAALPPTAALDLLGEGPELGSVVESSVGVTAGGGAALGLAVFSSDGCPLCRELAPAVEALGRDPLVSVHVFDEVRDTHAWTALEVPGSPYAVAVGRDGTVLAKGIFNSARQLEGVLAAAERRAREPLVA
jgi:hypothetical protein